jgi:hypothetical protein
MLRVSKALAVADLMVSEQVGVWIAIALGQKLRLIK